MAGRRLSRQQQRRIKQSSEARLQQASRRSAAADHSSDDARPGLVVASHGHELMVEDPGLSVHRCSRRSTLPAVVTGDHVYWLPGSSTRGGVVVALAPRRNTLVRPGFGGKPKILASNIDQIVVVIAAVPTLNEFLIDRYLVTVEWMSARAIIALNKCDQMDPETRGGLSARLETYRNLGYDVVEMSAHSGEGLDALRGLLADRVSILLGQSGVGKSSLVKALAPMHDIAVGALSRVSGLGTHTTTHAALYHLRSGGDLIDSPGVRSFSPAIEAAWVEQGFREFPPQARQCRFNDCRHTVEPGCAVLKAVERGEIDERRYRSLLQLRETLGDIE